MKKNVFQSLMNMLCKKSIKNPLVCQLLFFMVFITTTKKVTMAHMKQIYNVDTISWHRVTNREIVTLIFFQTSPFETYLENSILS